jgi:hypothetical protein
MATSKRDRQRANRESKRQVEEQQKRRDLMLERVKRYGLIALIAVAVVVGANLIWGGSDDPETVTSTSVPVATSTTLAENGGTVTSTTGGTSTTTGVTSTTAGGTTTTSG